VSDRDTKFEEWAVVELFGHQRIAGKVSEATIGGCAFVRVDVPATTDRSPYTKYFGNGAIYAMTPCDEQVAILAAHEIERYNVPIRVAMPKQLAPSPVREDASDRETDPDEFEDDDERPFR
jgi:hypothetical protein